MTQLSTLPTFDDLQAGYSTGFPGGGGAFTPPAAPTKRKPRSGPIAPSVGAALFSTGFDPQDISDTLNALRPGDPHSAEYIRDLAMDRIHEIAANPEAEKQGTVWSGVMTALNVLDTPRLVVANLLAHLMDVKPESQDTWLGMKKVYGADFMKKLGIDGGWQKFVAGLVFDVATDPLTYAGALVGGIVKKGGMIAGTEALKAAEAAAGASRTAKAAEQVATGISKLPTAAEIAGMGKGVRSGEAVATVLKMASTPEGLDELGKQFAAQVGRAEPFSRAETLQTVARDFNRGAFKSPSSRAVRGLTKAGKKQLTDEAIAQGWREASSGALERGTQDEADAAIRAYANKAGLADVTEVNEVLRREALEKAGLRMPKDNLILQARGQAIINHVADVGTGAFRPSGLSMNIPFTGLYTPGIGGATLGAGADAMSDFLRNSAVGKNLIHLFAKGASPDLEKFGEEVQSVSRQARDMEGSATLKDFADFSAEQADRINKLNLGVTVTGPALDRLRMFGYEIPGAALDRPGFGALKDSAGNVIADTATKAGMTQDEFMGHLAKWATAPVAEKGLGMKPGPETVRLVEGMATYFKHNPLARMATEDVPQALGAATLMKDIPIASATVHIPDVPGLVGDYNVTALRKAALAAGLAADKATLDVIPIGDVLKGVREATLAKPAPFKVGEKVMWASKAGDIPVTLTKGNYDKGTGQWFWSVKEYNSTAPESELIRPTDEAVGRQVEKSLGLNTKRDRAEALRQAGLEVNSETVEGFKRGYAAEATIRAARTAKEDAELAPYMDEARKIFGDDDWAEMAPKTQQNEARILRDEVIADREAVVASEAADEATFRQMLDAEKKMDAAHQQVDDALTNAGWTFEPARGRGTNDSRYFYAESPDGERSLKIRVSDHDQPTVIDKRGNERVVGGYDEAKGERYAAADLSFNVHNETPEQIATRIQEALKTPAAKAAEDAAEAKGGFVAPAAEEAAHAGVSAPSASVGEALSAAEVKAGRQAEFDVAMKGLTLSVSGYRINDPWKPIFEGLEHMGTWAGTERGMGIATPDLVGRIGEQLLTLQEALPGLKGERRVIAEKAIADLKLHLAANGDDFIINYVPHVALQRDSLGQGIRKFVQGLRGVKGGYQLERAFKNLSTEEINEMYRAAKKAAPFADSLSVAAAVRAAYHAQVITTAVKLREFAEKVGKPLAEGAKADKGFAVIADRYQDVLKGWQFPEEIAAKLTEYYSLMDKPTPILDAARMVTRMMKRMLLLGPGYPVKNMIGDSFNSALEGGLSAAGLRYGWNASTKARFGRGLDQIIKDGGYTVGKLWKILAERGEVGTFGGGGQYSADLAGRLEELVLTAEKEGTFRGYMGGPLKSMAKGHIFQGANDLNMAVNRLREDTWRFGHVVTRLRRGDTLEEAVASMNRAMFDYAHGLTDFEKGTKGRAGLKDFFPFYSWTRFNTEAQMRQVFLKPWFYAGLAKAKGNVEAALTDGDLIPTAMRAPFIQENAGVQIGGGEKPAMLNIGQALPINELGMLFGSIPFVSGSNIPGQGIIKAAINQLSPLIRTPAELAMNIDLYRKQAIRSYPGQTESFVGMDLPPEVRKVAGLIRPLNEIDRALRDEGLPVTAAKITGFYTYEQDPAKALISWDYEMSKRKGAINKAARLAELAGDQDKAERLAGLGQDVDELRSRVKQKDLRLASAG